MDMNVFRDMWLLLDTMQKAADAGPDHAWIARAAMDRLAEIKAGPQPGAVPIPPPPTGPTAIPTPTEDPQPELNPGDTRR